MNEATIVARRSPTAPVQTEMPDDLLIDTIEIPRADGERIIIPKISLQRLQRAMGFAEPPTATPGQANDLAVLRYLFRQFRPRRHLEFGTGQGETALCCLEETEAIVWTINLPYGASDFLLREEEPNASEVLELHAWADRIGLRRRARYPTDSLGFIGRRYLQAGQGRRVCQIYADSRVWDAAGFPPDFFDSVLIDGGQDIETTRNDTRKALAAARPGGLLLWRNAGALKALASDWEAVRAETESLIYIAPVGLLAAIKRPEAALSGRAVVSAKNASRAESLPAPPSGVPVASALAQISVIIYAPNGAHRLQNCLESVLEQNYPAVECVVMYGGAPENVSQRLNNYDSRVRWVCKPGMTRAEAIQRAIQSAKGDLLTFCAPEDELLPNALQWAAQHLATRSETGAIYGDCYSVLAENAENWNVQLSPSPFSYRHTLCSQLEPPLHTAFFRRAVLEAAGVGEEPAAECGEDFALWIQLGLHTKIEYVRGLVTLHRPVAEEGEAVYQGRLEALERFFARPNLPNALLALRPFAFTGLAFWRTERRLLAGDEPVQALQPVRDLRQRIPDGAHLDYMTPQAVAWLDEGQPLSQYSQNAMQQMEENRFTEALACLQNLTPIDYWVEEIHYLQALCLLGLKRYSEAKAAAERELRLHPEHAPTQELARSLSNLLPEAIPVAPKPIPPALPANEVRLMTPLQAGIAAGAQQMARELLTEGDRAQAEGQLNAASEAFQRAALVDPSAPEPYQRLGALAWGQGDIPAAARRFAAALDRDPYHRDSTLSCVNLLVELSDYGAAEQALSDYLARHPNDAEAKSIQELLTTLSHQAIAAAPQALTASPETFPSIPLSIG